MPWTCTEPDIHAALARHPQPLTALAEGQTAAVVLRGAWPAEKCQSLIAKLVQRGLLYDPQQPDSEALLEQSIPEGHYLEGSKSVSDAQWNDRLATGRQRIDVGSSLGYRGSDPVAFFSHCRQTWTLFDELFGQEAPEDNPLTVLYGALTALTRGAHRAVTAYEPDGQRYGPAIVRAHYGGYTYKPHFDSVRLREKRTGYAVHQFPHQFAGVLVLQNAVAHGRSAQGVIHNCLWDEEVDPHLKAGRFHQYAAERGIESLEVSLAPGDLYFFNTRLIHEVPGVAGELPRIVLATFVGYDPNRPEIFVWS